MTGDGGLPLDGLRLPDHPSHGDDQGASEARAGAPRVDQPVAEVLVDVSLAHLDRPFEYSVPAGLASDAVPGARVRVRFAGSDVAGYLLRRKEQADHEGRLTPLRRVVSPEPVLTRALARLCRDVADHYAGTMADVARLAIPPRHARAESAVPPAEEPLADPGAADDGRGGGENPAPGPWADYPAGGALLRRLVAGESPWAAWTALPDGGSPDGWPAAVAALVAATAASGRGSVVVLPDHADLDRVAQALEAALGPDRHVRLTADQGPERRYRDWLRVLRGHVDVVIGSRSAAYAPVRRPGLFLWWDDGDDSHAEPRAPYPHVREVLRLRAEAEEAALVHGGHARSAEVQLWVQQDRLKPVTATPAVVRARAPRVLVGGEGHQEAVDPAAARARIPTLAWRTLRAGLERGPVLVQVPRRGYVVGLSCQECRSPVRCGSCHGPVALDGPGGVSRCRWCGAPDRGHPCPSCGRTRRRSTVVGERRTAEEIGRAFPGYPVRTSRAGQLLARVGAEPAVVVATPGAEPVAQGGYAAAVLLDGWALLDRAGLDSGLEALRRWTAAAALVHGREEGGAVVVAGVPPHAGVRPVEALVRWDPAWGAAGELVDRRELGLPPARRTALLTGDPATVEDAADALRRTDLEVLGPLPSPAPRPAQAPGVTGAGDEDRVQLLVREGRAPAATATPSDPSAGTDRLVTEVRRLRAARSLRKSPGVLVSRLDPVDLVG